MKRFALKAFEFTEHQLWGPSEARNAPDDRFKAVISWTKAALAIRRLGRDWAAEALDIPSRSDEAQRAYSALWAWFVTMAEEHGFVPVSRHQCHGDGFDCMGFSLTAKLNAGNPKAAKALRVLTPRYMLQTIGTEWGRSFAKTMWSDYAIRKARTLLNGGYSYDRLSGLSEHANGRPGAVIITDGRFRNEIISVKMAGGQTVQVYNPAPVEDGKKVEAAGKAGHASEAEMGGMPPHFFDFQVENDKSKGLLALENLCLSLGKQLFPRPVFFSTK
jgi:hypothetical protein